MKNLVDGSMAQISKLSLKDLVKGLRKISYVKNNICERCQARK